jgi:type IV/VI secretion system ImpK/VasF family protein
MNLNTNLISATTMKAGSQGFYRSRIYTSDININPLIAACDPLFGVVLTLGKIENPENSDRFLQDLAHEIRSFEQRAILAGYPKSTITAASYAICSLLDEAILNTHWGQTNTWSDKNLLSCFHNENTDDSYFFSIIDNCLENIENHIHLLELLYLCLNFGFKGKYKEIVNGQNELISISNRLYSSIGEYNLDTPKSISIHDEKPFLPASQSIQEETSSTIIDQTKINQRLFGALSFAIIISSLIYVGFNLKLDYLSKPIYNLLEHEHSIKNRGPT